MTIIRQLKESIDRKILIILLLVSIVSAQRFDIRTTQALYENVKMMTVDNDVLIIGRSNNPMVGKLQITHIQAIRSIDVDTNRIRGLIIGIVIAVMIRLIISPQVRSAFIHGLSGVFYEIFWVIFFAAVGGAIGLFIGSIPIPGEISVLTQMTKPEKIAIVKTLLENLR
ncbi:MAG: hypothetical protein IIB05_11210 [Bacteroidetes bacterium]|nr:hypothetical protein [Bacteroidota bacterium]